MDAQGQLSRLTGRSDGLNLETPRAIARSRIASTAAIYIYVQPLIAAAAGTLFRGEELTPVFLGAAALIFAGIWLVSRRPPDPTGGSSRR